MRDDDVRYASSMLDASESWYPAITAGSWVQLDLVEQQAVAGVVIQPKGSWGHHRVTQYRVDVCAAAAFDGSACSAWLAVDGGASFAGGEAGGSRAQWTASANRRYFSLFASPVITRLVKIYPTAYQGVLRMRVGLLVQHAPPSPPLPPP